METVIAHMKGASTCIPWLSCEKTLETVYHDLPHCDYHVSVYLRWLN